MRYLPIVWISLAVAACRPMKPVQLPPVPLPAVSFDALTLPEPDGTTVYVYEVETNADRYQFQVQVVHSGTEGKNFNFAMSNETQLHGNVQISPDALDTAHAQLNYFSSEFYELEDATSVWFSKRVFEELTNKGSTHIALKKPDLGYGSLTADGSAAIQLLDSLPGIAKGSAYHCEYNGAAAGLEAVFAVGSWKGRTVRYAVLNDPENPLILFMDIGFRIRLKQVWQLHEMPDPLALKSGSVLKYVYMHLDSVGPETFDYVDDTLLIRLNRFDAEGSAGVWALYRKTPELPQAKGTCLGLFNQELSAFSFWADPTAYCSQRPATFSGHCQGWWFNNHSLEPLRKAGNQTGFHFNGFERFETWQLKADESGMFARRREITVNGSDQPCFAHRITPAGNMSEAFMEFLPGKTNPILLRWDAGGYQGLWLHSVTNP